MTVEHGGGGGQTKNALRFMTLTIGGAGGGAGGNSVNTGVPQTFTIPEGYRYIHVSTKGGGYGPPPSRWERLLTRIKRLFRK